MNDEFLYVQIYKDLFEEIKQGKYEVGDKLPTEKEVSEKYNVSRITAQRAMNMLVEDGIIVRYSGVGSFVASKEEKVHDNVKREKKIIGMVVETIWNSFGIELFNGAYKKAEELGYNLVLKKSNGNQLTEMKAIEELIQMGASGIIIMPVHGDYYSDRILKLFVEGYPIVFLDRYLHGIHVPFVSSDNILATSKAVSYFIENNHEHIGMVTGLDKETTTLDDRKQGFIQSILESGLQINKEYIYNKVMNRLPDQDYEATFIRIIEDIKEFVESNSDITAIIAAEYDIAVLVKKAIEDLGKNVPEDMEIICFDSPEYILGKYPFTHIKQNENEMGTKAVEMLNNVINGEKQKERILLDTELILGDSTKNN